MPKGKSKIKLIGGLLIIFALTFFSSNNTFAFLNLPVLPGETQQISLVGSGVKIKGITDQENRLFVNSYELSIEKDGSFQNDIVIPLGETQVSVSAVTKSGKTKALHKKITAKDKYLFLVGIADGTLDFVEAGEGLNYTRDNSSFDEGFHVDGKISYYLAGKIKGKYLIKSSLDTDKSTQEKLFSNIDPNKYYPIYGDDSTVVYDVNSQGKVYLLLEWDKSGFTFGNYQTMVDDTKLAKYNRTLYGSKLYLETPQRTVYGEPEAKFSGFIAEANQYAGHSEFLATGGSLYYLRHRNLVEGSENVTIEIRDKNTGMVIQSIAQQANVDYEIKYDEGRILFNQPVLSIAQSNTIISNSILEGNPVYIVANYEYKSQEAFPIDSEDIDRRTGGLRITKALGDHIQLGGTYVQETKAAQNHRLYGEDVTIKLGNFTKLETEFAHTRAASIPAFMSYNGGLDFIENSQGNTLDDQAKSINFNTSLGEYFGYGKDFLAFSTYYQNIGTNFSPVDTLFEAGSIKYGFELSHKFTPNDQIRLLSQTEELGQDSTNQAVENQITAKKVALYSTQYVHTKNKWTLTSEYQQRHTSESLSIYTKPDIDEIVAQRVGYQVSENTSVFVGQQITLPGSANNNQTQLGGSTRINKDTSVQAQTAFGNIGQSLLLGLERQIDENTSTHMSYAISDSVIDGKSSTTSFGANTKINQNAKLTTERQFITNNQTGVYSSQLMGLDYQLNPRHNLGASYQRKEEKEDSNLMGSVPRDSFSINSFYAKPDKLKADNKFELREDIDDTEQIVFNNSAELKLTQDWFLFGEYDFALTRTTATPEYARIDTKHIGLAFRPVEYDWFNWLFKYIRLTDDRPQGLLNAEGGGFVKTNSTADVYASEFALDMPLNFQLVEKVSFKDEDTLSRDILGIIKTPESLRAFLWINRLNYRFTRDWEVAGEYRTLRQRGTSRHDDENGFLFELSRRIFGNVYLGTGCNFTSFADDFTDDKSHRRVKGVFLRLQGRY